MRLAIPFSKLSKTRINTDSLRYSSVNLRQLICNKNTVQLVILRYNMAQSAIKDSGQSPLGIQPFWEKATLEPPLRWENWRTQLNLAILAREGIAVDLLLADPPEHVVLPPEPVYEDAFEVLRRNWNEIDVPVNNKQRQCGKTTVYVLKL